MRVLLLASLKSETGNFSTAARIQKCLRDSDIDCRLHCISFFNDDSSVRSFVCTHEVQCVIGVHAWRAGRLLLDCPVPFAIIFGGTDLNEHHKDKEKLETMREVAQKARYLVAFSNLMRKQAVDLWPNSEKKVLVQPQAVCVDPSGFNLHQHLKQIIKPSIRNGISNGHTQDCSKLLVFLLVAGLRPVKDPLYLATSISEWHKEDNRVYLVIIGPELDTEFAREVKSKVQSLPGVLLMSPIPACDLHAAIQDSFAVVNSSSSEGMASAILEAMALGVPVLARNIPANSAVIDHAQSGLLFNSAQEFVTLAKELTASPSLCTYLTSNAMKYVSENHSVDKERATYISLVEELISLHNEQAKVCGGNSNGEHREEVPS